VKRIGLGSDSSSIPPAESTVDELGRMRRRRVAHRDRRSRAAAARRRAAAAAMVHAQHRSPARTGRRGDRLRSRRPDRSTSSSLRAPAPSATAARPMRSA
jgi:hypothetical protein